MNCRQRSRAKHRERIARRKRGKIMLKSPFTFERLLGKLALDESANVPDPNFNWWATQ